MDQHKGKAKRAPRVEIIALPPLRMVLVHAKDDHVSKAALVAAIRKIALESITAKKDVEPQTVKKIIEYLEKES
jgi:bisphosphoglycerate-independent phosphoglycerate mutase (AlkP superfamily)